MLWCGVMEGKSFSFALEKNLQFGMKRVCRVERTYKIISPRPVHLSRPSSVSPCWFPPRSGQVTFSGGAAQAAGSTAPGQRPAGRCGAGGRRCALGSLGSWRRPAGPAVCLADVAVELFRKKWWKHFDGVVVQL